MIRKASSAATLLLGLAVAGCNGGTDYAKPMVNFDGGSAGSGGGNDAGVDVGGRPAPMAGTGSTLLIGGQAILVGVGQDSCTSQVPPTGDRWCGVAVPSTLINLAVADLVVVNVTKAAAGASVRCDGSQPDVCIRLTSDPFIDANGSVSAHSFTGDTLIYYENTSQNAFAWRPGMAGGQVLTSTPAVFCSGHRTTDAVFCFANRMQDAAGNDAADLLAGPIPAPGSVLPKIDTMLLFLSSDDPNAPFRFSAQLSPAGDTIVWSARPTAAGVETLNTQLLGDTTSRRVVATDVSQPIVSKDGARFYWLSAFNYSPTTPAGTLQRAVFPTGTGATDLATTVAEFNEAGDRGLIFTNGIAAGRGTLRAIADSEAPAVVTLDTAVGARLTSAPDGSRVAYYKAVSTAIANFPLFDVYAAGLDLSPCHVTTTADAFDMFFSGSGQFLGVISAVVQSAQVVGINGSYSNLGDCSPHAFGQSLLVATPVGDSGFVFGDQTVDFTDVTLQYAEASPGSLGTGTVIQTRADSTYAVLPTAGVVVYTVNSGTSQDGLYVSGMLPFTSVAQPDAGTD